MQSDAVAEAMAKKLNVRKSDILDADADNMAVRLALAETDIINDTKEYLEEHGVCLDSFMRRKGRSNTIILVKNIAYGIQETELNELFERFGTIKRIVLPPARTLALVELEEPNEAKAAFRKLAYSKFKNLPLFLEWAPTGTFSGNYDANAIKARKEQDSHGTVITARHDKPKSIIDNEKEDADAMPVATVFVKNLNFSTEDDGLKQAFEAVGGLRSARVARKIDPRTRARLSMGFGFLEFTEKEDAMRCIKNMQKFNLDGHELLLKFSNGAAMNSKPKRKAGSAADQEEDDDAKRTKLLVKNIPFEATKKDLKLLFKYFVINSVRLDK